MKVLTRVLRLVRRQVRARRLGIDYQRGATWHTPEAIWLNGKRWILRAPSDSGTKEAFLNIFLDDCYGIESVKHPVRTVLDIGAHAGFFSMHARNTYPEAVIHAYEPNPAMEISLDHHSRAGRFEYFMEAVGVTDGRATLDIHPDSVQTRSFASPTGDIPQVSFHKCIQRLGGSVDILKMDCEGAEWDLFADTDGWKKVRYLAMEYHLRDGQARSAAAAKVATLGFRVLKQTTDGPTWGLLWAERGSRRGSRQ